jgi:hypothetical protein
MMTLTDSREVYEVLRELKRGRIVAMPRFSAACKIASETGEISLLEKLNDIQASHLRVRMTGGQRKMPTEQVEWMEQIDPNLVSLWKIDNQKKSEAKSGADRVAAHVARRSDIGAIPAIVDEARRESCRYNLRLYGVTYCRKLLKHDPSENMTPFIDAMQSAILNGGQIQVRWPRGKGKTAWVKIAIAWAISYHHRQYVVAFAANQPMAKGIIADVWKLIETSDSILEDFPALAFPVRALDGVAQRCATQSYLGKRTGIYKGVDIIKFAKLTETDEIGFMVVARGVDAGTRGLVDMDMRPDFIFFDDLQTRKGALSDSRVKWLEDFITQDAMCMAGHDSAMAAVLADTPIAENDLSERFADKNQHPEWITIEAPLVIKWPKNLDFIEQFGELYKLDIANKDLTLSISRAFFVEHQAEIEDGVVMLDPLDGDETEVSAFHHALILYWKIGREGFLAEYQMQTRRDNDMVNIDPDTVSRRLNNYEFCVLPRECRAFVAYCDVNASSTAGLRWVVMAVGSKRVCAIAGYGKYPARGRLYPVNVTETQRKIAIAQGIVKVHKLISELPLRNVAGKPVTPAVLCFDSGWETKVVTSTIRTIKSRFPVIASKGFGWRNYKPYKRNGEPQSGIMAMGDHCHLSESENGVFLASHTDYWKEEMQRSLLAPPLMPGSLSFWGDDHTKHYDMAEEICNEKLVSKFQRPDGQEQWDWNKKGMNHWLDSTTGCFYVASWYRFYDATDLMIGDELRANASAGATQALAQRKKLTSNKGAARMNTRFRLAKNR